MYIYIKISFIKEILKKIKIIEYLFLYKCIRKWKEVREIELIIYFIKEYILKFLIIKIWYEEIWINFLKWFVCDVCVCWNSILNFINIDKSILIKRK